MTLEEAVVDVTNKNQSVSNRIDMIKDALKDYRAEQGLDVLTLRAINAEAIEVDALWTA